MSVWRRTLKAAAENNEIKGAKRYCGCNMLAWQQKKIKKIALPS